jgi:hypothetical protein
MLISIQYITNVGPGPKYRSDKITKTSPIEITEEIFGKRTLIVATKIETKVRRIHSRPNSEPRVRLKIAAGMERARTVDR